MQKKLLAILATVTIVLSMFSGITFAADSSHKILLNATTVTASIDADFQQIAGSVLRQNGTYDGNDFQLEVIYEKGNKPTQRHQAKSGTFSFYIYTDVPPQDIRVNARMVDASGNPVGSIVATATINVRYNVKTEPLDLNFSYNEQYRQDSVIGTVTDRNNRPVAGANVSLMQSGVNLAPHGLQTSASGHFGMLVANWVGLGEIELRVDNVPHKTGKIGGIPAKLSVAPNKNVFHSISSTGFKVEGSGFAPSRSVSFILKKDSALDETIIGSASSDSNGFVTYEFKWKPTEPGVFILEARQGVYAASSLITVVNPSGYNFVNTDQLMSIGIGTADGNQLRIGKPNGTYLVTWDGYQFRDDFYYDVYVDNEQKADKKSYATIGIEASQYGTKAIRIVAYRDTRPTGSHTPVFSFVHENTFIAKVEGWSVNLDVGTLTVNETRDLTFVVKDENGASLNNATIKFDRYELGPHNYNSQNGTYVFKGVQFSSPGVVPVSIKLGVIEKARLTLNVVGQKVYHITSPTAALLQAQSQTVRFNVSKGSQALIPQALEMEDSKGRIRTIPFTVASTSGSYATIDAVITPELAGDLLIRARNHAGTECGEITLTSVAPKIVLLDDQAKNVTENIKTKVKFKVVDPRDNSTLQSNITLSVEYAALTVYDAHNSLVWSNALLGSSEHTITILATDAQYETASNNKGDVSVLLKVNNSTIGRLPIKPAVLDSTPKMIIIGAPTPLTLTYKDANGKPIADKMVQVQEGNNYVDIGHTNSSGQIVYPPTQAYGTLVNFRAATEVSKQFVPAEVRFGYDSERPEVTYDAESKTDTTTIIITDNVRLTRVRINEEDIDLFVYNRYEHTLKLKPGLNKFRVQAQDANYNSLDKVIEINYVASTDPPVVGGQSVKYTIGKTTYYADGAAKQLEAAPFLRGDHTLVPVRALQSIGAIFAWDSASRTATFQLDSNAVKVTIGKSTAIVNGKAAAMPIAAELVNDRTMVPFRFVGQSLGLHVDYVAATKDIIITHK